MSKFDPFLIAENIDSGRKRSLEWVEDSYQFNPAAADQGEARFLSLALSEKKIKIFFWLLLLGLIILLGRSFYLQVFQGEHYAALAENNRARIKYLRAPRGVIYDRGGRVLTQNVSGFSLLIDPVALPKNKEEKQKVLQKIADLSGIDISEINQKIEENKYYFQPLVIKTGIEYERAMALKIASADWPAISLETDSWRAYPNGEAMAHLLGYVGKINSEEYQTNKTDYLLSDNIGKTGLEKYYEDYLRGRQGERRVEIDALGREKKTIATTPLVPGDDLFLTIDADLQNKIHEILQAHLKNSKAAAVIVSNPQNGEILALVDYPSYDNNLFSTGISQADYQKLLTDERQPLFFRAITGEYPSGSSIKPVIASAALEEGIVDENTTFNSVGGLRLGEWFFPDWLAGGHGSTNLFRALAQSVNTYFYYIGGGYGDFVGLGVEKIAVYLKKFGLGQPLGIDLGGESPGLVPTPEWKEATKKEKWYIGDTYHLAIGQGDLLVTPLQVNSFTATVANGGKIYRPHLVKEIVYPDKTKEMIMPQIMAQDFIKPANLALVRQGMREAVTTGSARGLYGLPVEAAGKTGTAQWNSQKSNHAWFNAFAPYDNPTFCITVLVEEGGEGSAIAVPIAREIMLYWFGREGV